MQTYMSRNPMRNEDSCRYSLNQGIESKTLIEDLQQAPSRVRELESERIYMMGDCPSCPSCSCISQGVQFLAVIEAPATVPIMVPLGAIMIVSK